MRQAKNSRTAKMTVSRVLEMRRRYAEGETQSSLARAFDLSVVQVGRIVRGESFREVGGAAQQAPRTADESLREVVRMRENGGMTSVQEDASASQERFLAMQRAMGEILPPTLPQEKAVRARISRAVAQQTFNLSGRWPDPAKFEIVEEEGGEHTDLPDVPDPGYPE